MNAVVNFETNLTMSSLEIADLVESRHDKVKQSTERLSERGVIARPPMGDVQETKGNNRPYTTKVYIFQGEQGRRDSYVVVAQLCPEFTARLVDRWQELEQQAKAIALPDFTDPIAAARAWADAKEGQLRAEKEAQEKAKALEVAAPAVSFVENYVYHGEGCLGFRDVARLLKAKESDFGEFLDAKSVMYKSRGKRVPYKVHLDAERFEVKTGVTISPCQSGIPAS
ncbi:MULTISPECIES: phage antirepressor KilAC domain-containing protein [unclassified Halomonas]|uniref:phage antirepressor KilAC domain-containing protein n=1 Tax=unclassified Halomonas TaxID=2609666 RepID=UPI000C8DEEEF|nr:MULTISPECIES: phage antirepressor KilAC domain-containing protein [unclassified Halomonas]MAR73779.1 hypothetical protein [Halomonas sp.]